MLIRLLLILALSAGIGAARGADDIAVVYLGTHDCPYCQHWEARAKGELLASSEGKSVRYFEIRGETLRQPIVERHYPDELKWLARRLGPSRGVPRVLLLVNGQVAWSVYGTNEYQRIFLPALRQAVARRDGKA
jgi:hypothetical protein